MFKKLFLIGGICFFFFGMVGAKDVKELALIEKYFGWGDMIGGSLEQFVLDHNGFEPVFAKKKGKGVLFKRLSEQFWDGCFVGENNGRIEVITFVIVNDFSKAKVHCKKLISMMINKYGKNFEIKPVKLDSTVSEEKGYALVWQTDKSMAALKFGPINPEAERFQLQLTFYDVNTKSDFLNIDKNAVVDSADLKNFAF